MSRIFTLEQLRRREQFAEVDMAHSAFVSYAVIEIAQGAPFIS